MNIKWSEEENELIKQWSARMSDRRLAVLLTEKFQRRYSMGCVRKQRQRLGIKKLGGRGVFTIKKQKR